MRNLYSRLILLGVMLIVMSKSVWAAPQLSEHPSALLQQGVAAFLHPPYYGTEQVNCVYDHEYPIYDDEDDLGSEVISTTVVHYNGTRWSGPCVIGQPSCYSGHNGIDYDMSYERVLASANGNVTNAGWYDPRNHGSGYGLWVRIDHQNGYQTIYGHLSAIAVDRGTQITDAAAGRVIGISGNTGTSTGTHLHFEVEPG